MKNLPYYLAAAIALASVAWYVRTRQAPSSVEISRNAPVSPVIEGRNDHDGPSQDPVLKIAKLASPRPSSDEKNPYAQKPTDEVIDFKVVNGLAIAYGDTLLGKVPPDFEGTVGRNESPRVQTWDKPEIPYFINPSLPEPQRVQRAIDYFNQHTAVHFIQYDGSQKDALVFEPGDEECISYLGKIGGLQPIRLQRGCGTQEILHEIMHALGFIHEQSRPDRDQYVDILWNNIDEKFQSQFAMVPDSLVEAERDSPFDYHSVMLYRPTIFAAHPGQATMQSKSTTPISPVTEGLSDTDIERVNRLYGAPKNL